MTILEYLEAVKPHYTGYQELHVHTVGSFRDAANTVNDVFDSAEEFGRNAVAITDHGNWTRLFIALKERTKREKAVLEDELLSEGVDENEVAEVLKAIGTFDSIRKPTDKMVPYITRYPNAFINAAKKAIQFCPGIEMYETLPGEDERYWHILFLAKDWEGIRALFLLCNLAQLNKRNGQPCCTIETIKRFLGKGTPGYGHVIATSACMGGKIQDTLLSRYHLNLKKKTLEESKSSLTDIDPKAIETMSQKIEDISREILDLRKEISDKKSLAGKKFETAIKRAQKALDKAKEKANNLSFDIDAEGALIEAETKLAQLMEDREKAQNAAQELPQLKQRLEESKVALKNAKAALSDLEKAYRPAAKVNEKIAEIDRELSGLGNLYEQAKAYAQEYEDVLGKGNFYLELQDHGLESDMILTMSLAQISRETGIPMTVANDVHYKNPAMQRKRDIIAALRYPNLTVEDIANRQGNDQLYFKSNEEMKALFKEFPEALENTSRIAEQCNVFYDKAMHLPQFVDPAGDTPGEYLKKMALKNVPKRYPDCKGWTDERKAEFKKRLSYELGIIEKMGFSSYISIVEDFIRYTKERFGDGSVGPGRGSGAGSLVCYLVGITNIDPLRYGLIFERFLNPERVSMPDIDTDFAPSIRKYVVDYVADRYAYRGEDYPDELKSTVCSIYTEGELAARSSIRQVGKVTGVPLSVCDKIAKLVPATIGMTLKKAIDEVAELKEMYRGDPEVKRLLDDALLVEGTPIQTGVHAAGVIVADKPVSAYAPLFWNEDANAWVIQFDMVSCEADCGLLKFDFLGLRNLDIIMRCEDFIWKTKHIRVDSRKIEQADDPQVISEIYAKAKTNGVFQFESGGMKKTLRSFAPTKIDDIILLNAAYRPGPMQYIPQVTDVKFGRKEPNYFIPELKSILEPTYGSPIYQEQIQQIFHEIAGFSLGQADVIRRAMSKKHLDELVAAKDGFVAGFKAKGAKEEDIERFWTELLEFAKYGFNKSHAAAYSVLSYHTAWLKCYYPVEYMASLLSFSGKDDMENYVSEAREAGIEVLPPNVNCSIAYTAPTKTGKIRLGLEGLMGVSTAAGEIVNERRKYGAYTSLTDFVLRCAIGGVGRGPIETLAKTGALVDFVSNRQELVENLQSYILACKNAIRKYRNDTGDDTSGGRELYEGIIGQGFQLPQAEPQADYDTQVMFQLEKECAGCYLTGNPLEKYRNLLAQYQHMPVSEISAGQDEVALVGLVTQMTVLHRKSDNAAMCRFSLEDGTGSVECICFTQRYKTLAGQMNEGSIVLLKGRIEAKDTDEPQEGEKPNLTCVIRSCRKLA